ncbi:hypothetical protein ABK040_015442 [Willaertia magna]
MTTTQSFDSLVASSILLFSHCSEWSLMKPFLISSNFNNIFRSNEFSKQYLQNLFQLNPSEINQLELILRNNVFNNKTKEKSKRKRRKAEEKIVISNYFDILKIYIQCCNKQNYQITQMKDLILNYNNKQQIDKINNNPLKTIKNLLKLQSANNKLNIALNEFLTNNSLLNNNKEIFDNKKFFKEIFIQSFRHKKKISYLDYEIEYIYFTQFGFPLFIKSGYDYEDDDNFFCNISESTIINNQLLFRQEHKSSEQRVPHFETQFNFDEQILQDLKLCCFTKECLDKFSEKEIDLIVYEWLQCGLLRYTNSIERKADDYGRVLNIFGHDLRHNNDEEEENDAVL